MQSNNTKMNAFKLLLAVIAVHQASAFSPVVAGSRVGQSRIASSPAAPVAAPLAVRAPLVTMSEDGEHEVSLHSILHALCSAIALH